MSYAAIGYPMPSMFSMGHPMADPTGSVAYPSLGHINTIGYHGIPYVVQCRGVYHIFNPMGYPTVVHRFRGASWFHGVFHEIEGCPTG